ncbi:MAG: invasion associated locus B family protein [Bradyrhizobium sp.]
MWVLVAATLDIAGERPAELSPAERAAVKPSETEVGPRGQPMPRDIRYSAWRKICLKSSDAKTLCRTTSEGTWDTGQMAVRVDLIESPGGSSRLQIFVPVGLYLQPGVKVAIDQGTPIQIPYSWCLTNICVAGTPASPELIQAMESGVKLTLEVVDSRILTIATSLPLDQFAAARNAPTAQVFEFLNDDE